MDIEMRNVNLATAEVYNLYDEQYAFVRTMRHVLLDCQALATVEMLNSCTGAAIDIFDLMEDDMTNRLNELNDLGVAVMETAEENGQQFVEDNTQNIEENRQNIFDDLTSCVSE
jgi:hypothetical protein